MMQAERDRLDFQEFSQAALVDALVVRQNGQPCHCEPRQAGTARVLLKALRSSRATSCSRNQVRRVRFHGGSFVSLLMYKLAANENAILLHSVLRGIQQWIAATWPT